MRTLRQDIDFHFRYRGPVIVAVALFPGWAKRNDSPARVLRWIAISTAMQFTLRYWVQPRLKAAAEAHRLAAAERGDG